MTISLPSWWTLSTTSLLLLLLSSLSTWSRRIALDSTALLHPPFFSSLPRAVIYTRLFIVGGCGEEMPNYWTPCVRRQWGGRKTGPVVLSNGRKSRRGHARGWAGLVRPCIMWPSWHRNRVKTSRLHKMERIITVETCLSWPPVVLVIKVVIDCSGRWEICFPENKPVMPTTYHNKIIYHNKPVSYRSFKNVKSTNGVCISTKHGRTIHNFRYNEIFYDKRLQLNPASSTLARSSRRWGTWGKMRQPRFSCTPPSCWSNFIISAFQLRMDGMSLHLSLILISRHFFKPEGQPFYIHNLIQNGKRCLNLNPACGTSSFRHRHD